MGSRTVKAAQWALYVVNVGVNFLAIPKFRQIFFGADWREIWVHAKRYCRVSFRIFGVELELEPHAVALDRQYIVVANHRSWFDQLALALALTRPLHFLAKREYFRMPLLGGGMRLNRFIPVDEGKLTDESRDLLENAIGAGGSIVFYPEGTRGTGRRLLPFKPGAFRLAAKTGVPVLPVFIVGSEELLSKHRSLLSVRSGKIRVAIGDPVKIPSEGWEAAMTDFEARFNADYRVLCERHPAAELTANG